MASKSLWMDVIGSGIAGISTAFELCRSRKTIVVIDRGRIAGGMTSRTSAHLALLCDDLVSEMTKIKGAKATKLFCASQAAAIDRIATVLQNLQSIWGLRNWARWTC